MWNCVCLELPEPKPSQLSSCSAVLESFVLFELELRDTERMDDQVATPPGPTTRLYVLSIMARRAPVDWRALSTDWSGRDAGASLRVAFTPSSEVLDALASDDVDTGTLADGDCTIA